MIIGRSKLISHQIQRCSDLVRATYKAHQWSLPVFMRVTLANKRCSNDKELENGEGKTEKGKKKWWERKKRGGQEVLKKVMERKKRGVGARSFAKRKSTKRSPRLLQFRSMLSGWSWKTRHLYLKRINLIFFRILSMLSKFAEINRKSATKLVYLKESLDMLQSNQTKHYTVGFIISRSKQKRWKGSDIFFSLSFSCFLSIYYYLKLSAFCFFFRNQTKTRQ